MAETRVLSIEDLPVGRKKAVKVGETEILVIRLEGGLVALQAKCPHAGAPLEDGAVCNGRLVCPWHLGTFALPSGELLEPPPMESLKMYPVRLDGTDVLVDTDPLPRKPLAKQTTDRPVFAVIGAGAAGAMAVTTLRQGGFGGRIVWVDPVSEEPVDRTQLSKDALAGKMPMNEIALNTSFDLERLTMSVTGLNAAKQEVQLSNGALMKFDKALVVTGGKPKRLEIPGSELAHTIRHPEDVVRIHKASEGARNAVIIGTSFIGLEAASALLDYGLQVTVIGQEKLPFAKQFGEQVARSIMALHDSNGTKFRLGVEIVRITKESVTVREGSAEEELPADLVIMGVGVSPELGFTHDLPAATNGGGIKTDTSLRATQAVWVAGDIANMNGTRIEHWRVAQQHGRIAALGMMGQNATYEGVPFFWTYHFGKTLNYLGHAERWDETFIKGDIDELKFMVFYIRGGRVTAVLSCEYESQTAALAELMRGKLTLKEALSAVD